MKKYYLAIVWILMIEEEKYIKKKKNLQSSYEKNTHYCNETVINKTIHKYILKKMDQITD